MKIFAFVAAVSAAIYPALPEEFTDTALETFEAQETVYTGQPTTADNGVYTNEPVMVSRAVIQDIPEEPEEDFIVQDDAEYSASAAEIDCLVAAVHYEARGEPIEGRVAVVEVVLARRDSGKFPSNACAVIKQKAQFSFVKRGHIPPVRPAAYETHKDLVMDVLEGRATSSARGATYFHASYVNPKWRHSFKRISRIGRHLFYGTS